MAFIFTIFFTLYNKLWFMSLISLCVFTGTYTMYSYLHCISNFTYLLLNLVYALYMATSYSSWYRTKLKRMGYRICNVIFAENLIDAKLKLQDKGFF
nr:DUF2628 domain-containing protein [Ehrlichia ruminantium]